LVALWQEAGRSSGFPVHWPLCPAPLPPFVGGAGLPNAAAGTDAAKTPATSSARLFLIGIPFVVDSAQPQRMRLNLARYVELYPMKPQFAEPISLNYLEAGMPSLSPFATTQIRVWGRRVRTVRGDSRPTIPAEGHGERAPRLAHLSQHPLARGPPRNGGARPTQRAKSPELRRQDPDF
jgi:hypothetical protein